jgi:hypothetical protein
MAYGTINADVIQSSVSGVSLGAGNASAFKNRIINGAMQIDQRNAGASLTVNSTAQKYPVDRFYCENGTDGVFTIQQSSSAPAGFTNSVVATVTTTDTSIGASQYAAISQQIEGYNVSDMNFGTANAKTFTLSFWVNCSVTGTFGGTFRNSADTRSYPFSYTISSANTWEQKSITVAGDTSGTWVANNGIGLKVWFSFAAGTTLSGTANAWASATYLGTTGATNLLATNGATFYITGVQLEVGSSATGFEYRDYGRELMLCQRYYEKSYNVEVVPGTSVTANSWYHLGGTDASSNTGPILSFRVTKRTGPTMTVYQNGGTVGTWNYSSAVASGTGTVNTATFVGANGGLAYINAGATWVAAYSYGQWVASAEL